MRLCDADIARMAAHLGIGEDEFIAEWTRLAPNRDGLILEDRADGACAMLDSENRCRVYPARPEKCRTFPHEWTNSNSAEYCPGLRAIAEA